MKTQLSFASLVACALFAAGCGEPPAPAPVKPVAHSEGDGHDHASEHAHPEHGPHGGDLVELGKEEFHAEVVHDEDSGKVTIYILDGEAKKAVPITATELTINVKHDGKGEQFKVAAAPQEGDGEGKASRFVSDDKELAEDIEHEARLVVEIDGKSFTGEIKHDHNHGDHKHEKK
ncbi:MAG: hypothetical protein FD138_3234 [Planctomycetota bacterium]|nr:MAG: hypothetical protein FD138_3234 [Planctomycetota bacterium]